MLRPRPKKETERIIIENFISNESLGLRVKSIEASETPDFFIHDANKLIGVEIRNLIHPDLIEKERFKDKLIQAARLLFKEKYKDEIEVLISFSDVPIVTKRKSFQNHAEDLMSLVEKMFLPNRNYEFRISSSDMDDVNEHIERISVLNVNRFDHWQSFGAFRVNYVDVNWIKEIIAQKESLIDKYKRQSDEKWLLLASNFGYRSDTHRFDYLHQEKFESRFDKVYLFKYRDKEIIQLK